MKNDFRIREIKAKERVTIKMKEINKTFTKEQQQQFYQKANNYVYHTHCQHLAQKAIQGRQCGYSTS